MSKERSSSSNCPVPPPRTGRHSSRQRTTAPRLRLHNARAELQNATHCSLSLSLIWLVVLPFSLACSVNLCVHFVHCRKVHFWSCGVAVKAIIESNRAWPLQFLEFYNQMGDDGFEKSDREVSHAANFVRGINLLALLAALALIALGIWLATRPGDCEKYATVPVFLIGAFFLFVAALGLFGSWFLLVPVLYTYLVLTFVVVIGFLGLSIFLFIVTQRGGGYHAAGQTFKEYNVGDYSDYVQDRLNKDANWNHLKAVIAATDTCAKFDEISPVDYPYSDLSPLQSGCCRPPAECGYTMTGNGTFSTTRVPLSDNPDCTRYANDDSIKCYDCDSCKGAVAQDLKRSGRVAGIVTLVIFIVLVGILVVACHVGHRVRRANWRRVEKV